LKDWSTKFTFFYSLWIWLQKWWKIKSKWNFYSFIFSDKKCRRLHTPPIHFYFSVFRDEIIYTHTHIYIYKPFYTGDTHPSPVSLFLIKNNLFIINGCWGRMSVPQQSFPYIYMDGVRVRVRVLTNVKYFCLIYIEF